MNIIDVILDKKHGKELSREQIEYFIRGYVDGEIADYQASALLMAINMAGMTDSETFFLTDSMLRSGETVGTDSITGVCVDKHSTGGVGDSTTFIVAPILASLGFKVAKMSGRALGHTGGTLDKLESIEGLTVDMSRHRFVRQVNAIGLAVMGQTAKICPADKKLYALRDVTGTVDSIPLIASSVMCKKLAGGADVIVLDVKCGSGAFMKDVGEAVKLAELMCRIGRAAGKTVSAVISDMNQPLDSFIGNALEIRGALNVLRGERCPLEELSVILAAHVVTSRGVSYAEAKKMAEEALQSGAAYAKFVEMVEAQGGNLNNIRSAEHTVELKSGKCGYISAIDASGLGSFVSALGGGRVKKTDKIDHGVGLEMRVRIGDKVEEGDVLAICHYNKPIEETALEKFYECFDIVPKSLDKLPPSVYAHIDNKGNVISGEG